MWINDPPDFKPGASRLFLSRSSWPDLVPIGTSLEKELNYGASAPSKLHTFELRSLLEVCASLTAVSLVEIAFGLHRGNHGSSYNSRVPPSGYLPKGRRSEARSSAIALLPRFLGKRHLLILWVVPSHASGFGNRHPIPCLTGTDWLPKTALLHQFSTL